MSITPPKVAVDPEGIRTAVKDATRAFLERIEAMPADLKDVAWIMGVARLLAVASAADPDVLDLIVRQAHKMRAALRDSADAPP